MSSRLIALDIDGPASAVMAGLVPAIHALRQDAARHLRNDELSQYLIDDRLVFSWMAASSAAKTPELETNRRTLRGENLEFCMPRWDGPASSTFGKIGGAGDDNVHPSSSEWHQ
jgi:hypothetical protein